MADDSDAATPAPSEKPAEKGAGRTNKRLITGAAIGIGSAALVAALLYANRARKSDKA